MSEEKSKQTLVKLTHDFVELLISRTGEEVDLKEAGNRLGAAKRRLYDVTNVLAGIGVIERCGKAKVKWIGNNERSDEADQIARLVAREQELDRLAVAIDESIAALAASEDFLNYAWVSEEDVMRLVDGDQISLFALRGPSDLTLEVPEGEAPNQHRLICTSASGAVDLIPVHPVGH
jgi:transcription factor E2F3